MSTSTAPAWPAAGPRPLRGLTIAIVLLLVVGALVVVARDDSGPGYPDEWDPRVAGLIDFVERDRGLQFDHPVHVEFLSPAEYTEAISVDTGALNDEDREGQAVELAAYRALGIVQGEVDLAEALEDVRDAGTLAFYSPDDQRIRVRGSEVTVALRVTLVHELTHALQDQAFDLGDLLGSAEDTGSATARRALGEGDAVRVERDYVLSELSDTERADYEEQRQVEIDAGEAGTADVPDVIEAAFTLPYALGAPFLQVLLAEGGNRRVDDAFDEPPATVEHLVDPASFLAGEGAVRPDAGLDDDDVLEQWVLGSGDWFLVLAQRIDPALAFEAVLGWGGDRAVRYEEDGDTCVRVVFEGDTERDEAEMADAIEAWANAMPGDRAERVSADGRPGLQSCDPGPDADLQIRGISFDLLSLPATWAYLEAAATARGVGPDGSRCFARAVLEGTTYVELADPAAEEAIGRRLTDRFAAAYSRCGSGDR